MADSTVNFGFPYPEGGDAVAVHTDVENLAKAADATELQTNVRIDDAETAIGELPTRTEVTNEIAAATDTTGLLSAYLAARGA